MHEYRIIYTCSDGYVDEEIVMAANRTMAFMMFEELGIVAEYCDWDVIATEAVFDHLKGDFTARQILADLAGGSVNDTTNSLTTKIVFGKERKPKCGLFRVLEEEEEGDD